MKALLMFFAAVCVCCVGAPLRPGRVHGRHPVPIGRNQPRASDKIAHNPLMRNAGNGSARRKVWLARHSWLG